MPPPRPLRQERPDLSSVSAIASASGKVRAQACSIPGRLLRTPTLPAIAFTPTLELLGVHRSPCE